MNRRQQLAALRQPIVDVFGPDLAWPIINLLDILAANEDERDDIISGAIHIHGEDTP